MGRVIRPVFGKPCADCGEQVPHARIRVLTDDAAARGLPLMNFDLICVECKSLRENEIRRRVRTRSQETFVVRTVERAPVRYVDRVPRGGLD